MPTMDEIREWPGKHAVGPDEHKIGKIDHVYVDRQTDEPTFAALSTGLSRRFGASSVQKDVVAKERVRLDTETVTEQVAVEETVRKEQLEVDGDAETRA